MQKFDNLSEVAWPDIARQSAVYTARKIDATGGETSRFVQRISTAGYYEAVNCI